MSRSSQALREVQLTVYCESTEGFFFFFPYLPVKLGGLWNDLKYGADRSVSHS